MNDLKALAVQVDERLADLYEARWFQQNDLQIAAERARQYVKQKREVIGVNRWGREEYGNWIGTLDEALATIDAMVDSTNLYSTAGAAKRYAAEVRFARAGLKQIDIEAKELDAVWHEEGRWTRAFLVLNSNGHIHSSMDCSTCYPSTRYEWLIAYSADDEATIVELAGETACTICYPSAPAEILNRPATIQSKARAEREAAAAEKAAAKAEREAKRKAKAPTATGESLLLPSTWTEGRFDEIKTERTARSEWNSAQQDIIWKRECGRLDKVRTSQERQTLIEAALAGKYGISPSEMRDQLLTKYKGRG